MLRAILGLLLLACGASVIGQPCITVVEEGSLRPISGAYALCEGHPEVMVADSNGRLCLRSGCERIELRATGYRSVRVDLAFLLLNTSIALESEVSELPPAEVEAWPRKQDRHALASATTLDSSLLSGFDRSSLRSATLLVPGVQWDERGHGGSARLSMRGSLSRSVYGVRGVKVYWGPFPLTLADGSTPLELLDPITVGSVDVVRSVGSPAFGTAPSGLLLAQAPFRDEAGLDVRLGGLGGAWGAFRMEALARTNNGREALTAGIVRQGTDGYRAQEWNQRDQAFIATRWQTERSITQVFVTWQSARWALPGSMDSLTAVEQPRNARPFSQLIDAHVEKEQLLGGISTEHKLSGTMRLRTTIDAQAINKKNPYGTSAMSSGYKDERIRAGGGRLSLGGSPYLGALPFTWEAGLEALLESDGWKENTYQDGGPGPLRVDADTRVTNLNAFLTTTTRIASRTTLHAAAGMERTAYDHENHLLATDNSLRSDPVLYPLIGLEHELNGRCMLHARYAESTSRPTVWEYLGTTGILRSALRPERVREVEAGPLFKVDSSGTSIEVLFSHREVTDQIQPVTAADGMNQEYVNSGHGEWSGAEFRMSLNPLQRIRVPALLVISFTGQWASGVSPLTNDANDQQPGVPGYSAALLLRAPLPVKSRFTWELSARANGATRAAWGSNAEVPSYAVLNERLLYVLPLGAARLELSAYVENLTDERYTAWVQVNDPGQRYYNPAPARSFYLGASLTFGRNSAKD